MGKILVVYHSQQFGDTKALAEALAEGAREAGSELSVNMVLLGTLVRHGNMPFGREVVEEVLNSRTKKSFLEMNRKAFDLGFQVK